MTISIGLPLPPSFPAMVYECPLMVLYGKQKEEEIQLFCGFPIFIIAAAVTLWSKIGALSLFCLIA